MNQIKITPELLAELKDKAEKATPAWLGTGGYEIYYDKPMTRILATQCVVGYAEKNDDAEYIAAANPQVVLALIAKIEQIEKEADWLAEKSQAVCELNSSIPCTKTCPLSGPCTDWPFMSKKQNSDGATTDKDWREAARKAVEEECKSN